MLVEDRDRCAAFNLKWKQVSEAVVIPPDPLPSVLTLSVLSPVPHALKLYLLLAFPSVYFFLSCSLL